MIIDIALLIIVFFIFAQDSLFNFIRTFSTINSESMTTVAYISSVISIINSRIATMENERHNYLKYTPRIEKAKRFAVRYQEKFSNPLPILESLFKIGKIVTFSHLLFLLILALSVIISRNKKVTFFYLEQITRIGREVKRNVSNRRRSISRRSN